MCKKLGGPITARSRSGEEKIESHHIFHFALKKWGFLYPPKKLRASAMDL